MFQYYPFNTTQVSVTATATQILPANSSRSGVSLVNTGSVTVYIGNSASVTTSTGYPLLASSAVGFDTTLSIYGITGSSEATVGVLETQ
jgi:hypothetical protein